MIEQKKVTDENAFIANEYQSDYFVSIKRKKVWKIELECFRQFKCICEKHNLRYFLIGGSLLGAVRHGGFIPWDDDMDVAMSRKDYARFLEFASKEVTPPFCLQASGFDNEFYCGFSRLCYSKSTALLDGQWSSKTQRNCGIFLDIFPLDAIPENKIKQITHRKICRLLTVASNSWIVNVYNKGETAKGEIDRIIRRFFRLFPIKTVVKCRDKWFSKYVDKPHNKWGMLCLPYDKGRWVWDKHLFDDVEIHPFEYETATIPKKWNEILKKSYGDWQKPVHGGSCHEGCFFDPDKPYTYYITHFDELKAVTKQKSEW